MRKLFPKYSVLKLCKKIKLHCPNPFLFHISYTLVDVKLDLWIDDAVRRFCQTGPTALTHSYSQIAICRETRNLDVK